MYIYACVYVRTYRVCVYNVCLNTQCAFWLFMSIRLALALCECLSCWLYLSYLSICTRYVAIYSAQQQHIRTQLSSFALASEICVMYTWYASISHTHLSMSACACTAFFSTFGTFDWCDVLNKNYIISSMYTIRCALYHLRCVRVYEAFNLYNKWYTDYSYTSFYPSFSFLSPASQPASHTHCRFRSDSIAIFSVIFRARLFFLRFHILEIINKMIRWFDEK